MTVAGDVSSCELQEAKIMHIQKYLDKPLHVTLRLAIEYTLPDLPSSSSGAPPALPNSNNNNSIPAAGPMKK